jgi:RNA polymerase sigma-70 factor (ECF subfamily)
MLVRVAMTYVSSRAVAEEVVQETWLGVLKGLDRFERRSSLKTWIFRIAANIARTCAVREGRCLPFSSLTEMDDERSVNPDRFFPPDHPRYPGHWARGPAAWETPEERLLSGETRDVILAAIEQLPAAQRLVVTLRDVEGWSAEETCHALELTDGNQRVLLHRGRSKLRAALERCLSPVEMAT